MILIKKFEVVKEHKSFDDIINNGKYIKNNIFIIYNKDNNLEFRRFGLAVGKKIGNAVTRNKVKRRLREIITSNKNLFKNGKDYIIIVKKEISDLKFQDMEKSLIDLLEKVK